MKFYNKDNIEYNSRFFPFGKYKTIQSRRNFLSKSIKTFLILKIGFISSCKEFHFENSLLSEREIKLFNSVLEFLWPDDGNGPSISEARVSEYILMNISGENFDADQKQYFKDGLRWIDETSVEEFGVNYEKLQAQKVNELFELVASTDWGNSWYSNLISMILEAVLADPVYGSNPEGNSYIWLEHDPGNPRPNENTKYQQLLKRKDEELVVRSLKDVE